MIKCLNRHLCLFIQTPYPLNRDYMIVSMLKLISVAPYFCAFCMESVDLVTKFRHWDRMVDIRYSAVKGPSCYSDIVYIKPSEVERPPFGKDGNFGEEVVDSGVVLVI
ncbi:hypothetical protein AVEN_48997-1 [Araneus ventricosus]|uniref:Uncharacterized protein n=1 Tax=Araneus ventricosus TaxID=182803 RepID=A0A4Y2AH39_ARAVE|nr:hypothetical protein AVEN_48997-1 [Araneus ventricosus]